MNPPILVPPIAGKPLLLYITTTEISLGALLAQEDSTKKESAVYYINQALSGYELNYTFIEKSCLVVVFASQKIRHYMLAHTIKLITKIDPLKYLLSKVTQIGQLAKWVMILSEFDIHYIDRGVIKGQAIANHIVEAPVEDNHSMHVEFLDRDVLVVTTKPWILYFDGSYTNHGSGARILFVTPQGHTLPRSYRLMFTCTNNTTEYEALVIGIKLPMEWKIDGMGLGID